MSSVTDTDIIMYECGLEVLHHGGLEKTAAVAGLFDGPKQKDEVRSAI